MGESAVRRATGLVDLFILLSIVLFVASVALGIGVFLYQEYLQTSINSKVDQLQRAKAAFEPSLIAELTRLDDRMRAGAEILGAHIAPSALFHMLESTTISSIEYSSLDLEAADAQHMTVRMDGVAGSVNSIALQADLFSKGGMLTSPIFSNINRAPDGVHFALSAIVNPAALNFLQLAAAPASAAAPQGQPSPFGQTPQNGAPPAAEQPTGAGAQGTAPAQGGGQTP